MLKTFLEDLKKTNIGLVGLYLTTLISSFVVLIAGNYKNIDFLTAIYVIAMGVSTICLIVCLILPFFRYYLNINHIFNKKSSDKYDAKVLTIIVTILISLMVIFIAFVNTYSNHTFFKFIFDLLEDHNLLKNFSTFAIDLGAKMVLIYMCALVGTVIGNKSKIDQNIRSVIVTLSLIFFFHFLVKFLVQLIVFERKYILKIMLYLLICCGLYFIGRHEYNLK